MTEFIGPSPHRLPIEEGLFRDSIGKLMDTVVVTASLVPEAVRALSQRTATLASLGASALHRN